MDRTDVGGKVAVVTGAGKGIGAAVTNALSEQGASVAAIDVNTHGVHEVSGEGPRVVPYIADVSDGAAVEDVVQRIEQDLGPIDILVNVAGVLYPGRAHEISDDDWHRTFAVNTTGVFHLCRAVSNRMIPRARGSIVTVSSNAGGIPRHGMAAYGASKAAATLFTKSLGLELAEYNIRCNVVSPGSTDTGMLRSLSGGEAAEEVIAGSPETFKVGIPLRKLARPDDIADAVLFLLSDRARHITMHDLYVDGGATLRA
jgi:2,3-dihydro-2,3-dihydroxybenzoate dehydrogenase